MGLRHRNRRRIEKVTKAIIGEEVVDKRARRKKNERSMRRRKRAAMTVARGHGLSLAEQRKFSYERALKLVFGGNDKEQA